MNNYKIVAYVNSIRTEAVVSANCPTNARKLFEAQYVGAKISITSIQKV